MADKMDAWIEGKAAGYRGEGAARPTDRAPIPVGHKSSPADSRLGYALLRENLKKDPPKEEGQK